MCAKPQREEDIPAPASAPAPWAVPSPPPPPLAIAAVGFSNRVAVQIALMTACVTALLCSVLFLLSPVWIPAAGFLAVYLYHRRTGQSLSTRAGARMGWITGSFLFGIAALMFTIGFVSQANNGQFAADLQQQMRRMPMADPEATRQALQLLESPGGQTVIVLCLLGFLFAVIMSFCAAGGALGAKILSKD
jgi:hypothetical protein